MSQIPDPYNRQHPFGSASSNNPSNPIQGTHLDAEFNAVKVSMDETQARLAEIQRDDGKLKNQSVGPDQLSQAALDYINADVLALKDQAEDARDAAAVSANASAASAIASAGSASASQASAVASAASAAASAASNARYCGASNIGPTTRLNGSPLQPGDEYQNTVNNLRYNWTGNAWVALNSSAQTLEEALANTVDPLKGGARVGFVRTPLADQITNTQQALSGQRINIFEFAKYIPVRVGPPSAWDWTLATAAAQAFLTANGKGIIEYPGGQFPHQFITKVNGVSLVGQGSYATYFTALPYALGVPYGLVQVGPGAVSGSHMQGIHIMGSAMVGHNLAPVNPTQWGCYFKAQWDVGYVHGGHWFSVYDDVRISNFNYGMWSRGGYTINNYQRPNQFLAFRGMFIQVPASGEALRLTGQHGQIEFSGGSAEGSDGMVAALCINLGMDPDPSTMADNGSGHGENTADAPGVGQAVQAPYNVNFSNSFSIQKSRKGLTAANTRQISIRGAWIEDIAELIELTANAQLLVEANHLANAASGTIGGGAAGSGYLFKLGTGTALEFKSSSDVIGTIDKYTDPSTNLNDLRSLKVEGLAFGDTYQKYKAAGYKTFTLTGAAIDVGAHKFVVMNPSVADPTFKLSILQATAAPGERITLRPLNGPITLTNSGNISLWGETEICCPQSGVLTLERIFQVVGNVEWVLVSVSEHRATGVPADGFYYPQNHRIWRRGAVASQQMGWIVTTAGLAGSTLVAKAMPNLAA